MQLKRLEDRVMRDEGYRAKAYQDTQGIWTIGYGTTRLIGRPVQSGDSILPDDAKRLLRADLYTAILDAQGLFERFEEMNSVRQEVLVNLAYNIGRTSLSGFVRLRMAAQQLDYKGMAEEMVDSLWFKQVKSRAQRLVAAMRVGDWTA